MDREDLVIKRGEGVCVFVFPAKGNLKQRVYHVQREVFGHKQRPPDCLVLLCRHQYCLELQHVLGCKLE